MKSFQAAAANADWKSVPGYGVILTEQPGAASWPITAASFILMHTIPQDAAASVLALKFFDWAYKNGAKMAEELDYIPMPANVVELSRGEWAKFQGFRRKARFRDELKGVSIEAGAATSAPASIFHLVCNISAEGAERMDMALQSVPIQVRVGNDEQRARILRRFRIGDRTFNILTQASAIAVLVILAGVMISPLVIGSLPPGALSASISSPRRSWNPVAEKFGALAAIYGTLVTSFIAMLIAVPSASASPSSSPKSARNSCGGRSASPSSCSPASRASSTASGACSCSPRSSRRICNRS